MLKGWKMEKIINVIFRVAGCILSIHVINKILQAAGFTLLVGINGYTAILALVLGIPGILGLYLLLYL